MQNEHRGSLKVPAWGPGVASFQGLPAVKSAFETCKHRYHRWIGGVADTVSTRISGFSPARVVTLVETDDHELKLAVTDTVSELPFAAYHLAIANDEIQGMNGDEMPFEGCHVELVLHSDRFLFRSLELPSRAAEFLQGVVRAQIDRLTPWRIEEAVYGWGEPVPLEGDRIQITVAAAAREAVVPLAEGILKLGANSVLILTEAEGGASDSGFIKLFDQRSRQTLDVARITRTLHIALMSAALAAGLGLSASAGFDSFVSARQDDIAQELGRARSALGANANSDLAVQRTLEQRKYEIAPAVIVIEQLSRILPDDTFLTALQIDGNKVRVSGIARNAPALISILEKSSRFARATFIAPSTRTPGEPGERFQIEAVIQPVLSDSVL